MAQKAVKSVAIRSRTGTLGEDYEISLDLEATKDTNRENATGYSIKDFLDNYKQFFNEASFNFITETEPVNTHAGIWLDTGHNNQEFPNLKSVIFDGNGGTWTWGLTHDNTDYQIIQYLEKFKGPVPQNITKKDRIFLGWFVQETPVWTKVEDVLSYPVEDGTTFVAQWVKIEATANTEVSTGKGQKVVLPINISFSPETVGIPVNDIDIDLTSSVIVTAGQNIGYTVIRQNNTIYNLEVDIPSTMSAGEEVSIKVDIYDQTFDFNISIENTLQLLITKPVSQVDNENGIVLNIPAPLPLQALDVYPNINNPEWLKVGNGIHGTIYLNNLDFYESTAKRAPTWPGLSVSSLPTVRFDSNKYQLAIDTGNFAIVFFDGSNVSLAEYQKYIQATITQNSNGVLRYAVNFVSSRIDMIDNNINQFLQENIDNIAFAIPVLA